MIDPSQNDLDPLIVAGRLLAEGESFAMATIVKTSGSTPRKVGTRMVVRQDRSIIGTIGGAAVEMIAIEKAIESLGSGEPELLGFDLNDTVGNDIRMVCGGKIEVLIEPFGTGARLHLFGAGHVAQPTARLAIESGFRVMVYDERDEWASNERFPGCKLTIDQLESIAEGLKPTDADYILIMTHCHDDDYKVLSRLITKPFFYLGVIGSKRKSVELRKHLESDGFSQGLISRITCPIGLDIGSHTPVEIAIATIAQLIQKRNGI